MNILRLSVSMLIGSAMVSTVQMWRGTCNRGNAVALGFFCLIAIIAWAWTFK